MQRILYRNELMNQLRKFLEMGAGTRQMGRVAYAFDTAGVAGAIYRVEMAAS